MDFTNFCVDEGFWSDAGQMERNGAVMNVPIRYLQALTQVERKRTQRAEHGRCSKQKEEDGDASELKILKGDLPHFETETIKTD
ncbi:hypothetical protein AVEN_64937-1 [Araneus ventricosus]|uniref:Uncharacterized protein n=1 Tax=Araneus ventricosus TaxID=182803 RepID=A0A4Y2PHE4_ARAVE|nr:hypothetical protein AVEN_64937-1 [Araneus ventricosus]